MKPSPHPPLTVGLLSLVPSCKQPESVGGPKVDPAPIMIRSTVLVEGDPGVWVGA